MKTNLYNQHLKLNAKIVDFSGFEMPISYPIGINQESNIVRNNVGIFDVSHMGQILIQGENSYKFVQYLTTNDVSRLKTGDCQYTLLCNNEGGIIDDLILYCLDNAYLLVVNASNLEKDFNWMKSHKTDDILINNISNEISLIAIQGPQSRKVLSNIDRFKNNISDLNFYQFYNYSNNNIKIISRTGYTGELGYEIYGSHHFINSLWEQLVDKYNVQPIGLAARDILRLEMCYRLYGNDMNENVTPYDCGLNWVVKEKKEKFIGKDAMLKKRKNSNKKLIYLIMEDRCIPRKNYRIICQDNDIGFVTSGTFSPTLKKGIAMAYVDKNKIGENKIHIKVRDKLFLARTINDSFIKETSLFE